MKRTIVGLVLASYRR